MNTSETLLKLLDPPGSCLYHYTRLCIAVEHILPTGRMKLPTGRMKLNPFSKIRDPRASKDLNPVVGVGSA